MKTKQEKQKLNKELVYACLALIFIASMAYGAYAWGQRNQRSKQVEEAQAQIDKKVEELDAAYQLAIGQKDKAIHTREIQIAKLRKDYQDLLVKIKAKAEQAHNIKTPETDEEMKQRLGAMGYKPR